MCENIENRTFFGATVSNQKTMFRVKFTWSIIMFIYILDCFINFYKSLLFNCVFIKDSKISDSDYE